jgi:hypothetical protein
MQNFNEKAKVSSEKKSEPKRSADTVPESITIANIKP